MGLFHFCALAIAGAFLLVDNMTVNRTMPDYQVRVVEERRELDVKIASLDEFTRASAFTALDQSERHRLEHQLSIMQAYSFVLGERINAFT